MKKVKIKDAILHVKLTSELSNLIEKCARSKSLTKSAFVLMVLSEKLQKEGYIKNPN